jgi:prepilin-type N-terminal cleavage/methylation domain-containing protein
MPFPSFGPRPRAGFTFLEMSIVLVIIAVVIGGGMTLFSASLQKREWQETQTKLKAIQTSLYDYRIANNRIPCPADVTLALTNQYFGYEAGTLSGSTWIPDAGACISYGTYVNDALTAPVANSVAADFVHTVILSGITTSSSTTVIMTSTTGVANGLAVSGTGIPPGDTVASFVANTSVTLTAAATASGNVPLTFVDLVQGMVPITALRLSDDYAIDGWGRRIMYTVDARFTVTNALTSAVIPATDTGYRITVNDQSGHAQTTMAAYVLVSFGPNGHGAYPRNGAAIGSRINSASNHPDELTNCDCNSSAGSNSTIPAGTFVQEPPNQYSGHLGDPTYYFDDLVAFATRSQLASPTER